jgi:hypothetical protein
MKWNNGAKLTAAGLRKFAVACRQLIQLNKEIGQHGLLINVCKEFITKANATREGLKILIPPYKRRFTPHPKTPGTPYYAPVFFN